MIEENNGGHWEGTLRRLSGGRVALHLDLSDAGIVIYLGKD